MSPESINFLMFLPSLQLSSKATPFNSLWNTETRPNYSPNFSQVSFHPLSTSTEIYLSMNRSSLCLTSLEATRQLEHKSKLLEMAQMGMRNLPPWLCLQVPLLTSSTPYSVFRQHGMLRVLEMSSPTSSLTHLVPLPRNLLNPLQSRVHHYFIFASSVSCAHFYY